MYRIFEGEKECLLHSVCVCVCVIYLHEKARYEGLPNVEVVILAGELSARSAEIEPIHDARELLTDVVCWLQGTVANKIIVAPLIVLTI